MTAQHAVSSARPTRCPNAPGGVMWDLRSGVAFKLSCGRWSCSACGHLKRQGAELRFRRGMELAAARGERVRFMTLTDGSGDLDMAALYAAWNRLAARLRRADLLQEYAAVVEAQASGRLHLHVLMTGQFIAQRRLSRMAAECGFGRIADIREMDSGKAGVAASARYMVKYLAKQEADSERVAAVAAAAVRRVRPVRCSRGWGPSQRDAEREVVRRWMAERGASPKPPLPDPQWVLVLRGRGDSGIKVLRAGEAITAQELDALLHELAHPWLAAAGLRVRTPERVHLALLHGMAEGTTCASADDDGGSVAVTEADIGGSVTIAQPERLDLGEALHPRRHAACWN